MRRLAVLATLALVPSCRLTLEDDSFPIDAGSNISASCMEATTKDDIGFLETKVFATACTFSGCHNGANDDAGMMDLRAGKAAMSLVNVRSKIDTAYMLVTPGMPNQSYMMMMVQHIEPEAMDPPAQPPPPPPTGAGYMPQNTGGKPICVQKREAIQRWIMAGAMP